MPVRTIRKFLSEVNQQRDVIWSLGVRDFRRKYVQNTLGIVWAIVDPIAFVGILYLIFSSRFNNSGSGEIPFVVYLLCGNMAFDLFSNLQNLTQVIRDHEFLVKKVQFRMELLPIVRLVSGLILHGIVMSVAISIILFNGIWPDFYWFQLLYYIFALSVFLTGASWLTSSVYLFFPDISHITAIINRVLFFLTPVFWKLEDLPEATARWVKLNPMVYIVNGYRDSLLYGRGFWCYPWQTLYFWAFTLGLIWAGITVHNKLRPHFAEVV
jgi:lipopolysaccharide transport system permease protein/teichoic acid transport system permease protein